MRIALILGIMSLLFLLLFPVVQVIGNETLVTVQTDRKSYHFTHLVKINGSAAPLVAGRNTVEIKIYDGISGKLLWDFPKNPLSLSPSGAFFGSLSFSEVPPKTGQDVYILEVSYLGAIGRTTFEIHNRTLAFTVRPDREKYTAKIVNGTLAGYAVYDGPDMEADIDISDAVVLKTITKGSLFDKDGNLVIGVAPAGNKILTLRTQVKNLQFGNSILKGHYSILDYTLKDKTVWLTLGQHVYASGTLHYPKT